MFKRKIISLFLSTILSLTIIFGFIFAEWENPFELVVMIFMYSLLFSPIILVYGLSISFLVEFISNKMNGLIRQIIAIVLLLTFACVSVFLFPSKMNISLIDLEVDLTIIAAVMIAIIAFIIEEILKYRRKSP